MSAPLSPHQFFHGTPYGGPTQTPGLSGVHVGTQEAARQALNARIGHPASGEDWSGTSEYGKTLLAGRKTLERLGRHVTGYSVGAPEEDFYAHQHQARGLGAPHDVKPHLFGVDITGPMSNTPDSPHEDARANGMMKGQLKKGNARRGYYYTNIGEDAGSVSAVVPSWQHLRVREQQ